MAKKTKSGKAFWRIFLAIKAGIVFILVAALVFVNYRIDRGFYFYNAALSRQYAQYLQQGYALDNYSLMNERVVRTSYLNELDSPLNTVAIGSSRILQLSQDMVGEDVPFFNLGSSGGGLEDMLGFIYRLELTSGLPQNLILGIDPWLLNPDPINLHPLCDMDLYNEFLEKRLGIDTEYTPTKLGEQNTALSYWYNLFSLSYLRRNIRFWREHQNGVPESNIVPPEMLYRQETDVLLSDGSVLYSSLYRNSPREQITLDVRFHSVSFIFMRNFFELDTSRCTIFEKTVQYLKDKGVNVIFLLTPYHPLQYEYVVINNTSFSGFFMTEPWFTAVAKAYDIPLYGSFNPFVLGCEYADFYDAWHVRREALPKFFPDIASILAEQAAGKAGSSWYVTGERMTPALAEQVLAEAYPDALAVRVEDGQVEGVPAYIYSLYSGEDTENGALLGLFAVTQNEGILYYFDTALDEWAMNTVFED